MRSGWAKHSLHLEGVQTLRCRHTACLMTHHPTQMRMKIDLHNVMAHELLVMSTCSSSGQANCNLAPTRSVDISARPELLKCNS